MDIGRAKASVGRRPNRKRVGRGPGSGHGKTSGRGHNGARSRSGWSSRGLTGGAAPLWRRLPKRGFSNQPFKHEPAVVNVGSLERFDDGTVVGPEEMHSAGLVKRSPAGGVKVLGEGELHKALCVRANAFSRSAAAKIEAAGGKAEPISAPEPPVRNPMRSPYRTERR
jgi:large subunit ribosomal protein L15